jgi:serine/threonine protein kinase/Tol biopolymer transport system component
LLKPGTRLGPYEIVGTIGAGGMGEVYRARDSRLGRDVAIKVLPSSFSADADRLHRFEQEARAAAALSHPNILAVHDIGTEQGPPFIVSELLEGQTLRDRLAAGPLPVRKAVAYAVAIARGLAAAHEKGITHRDLKPENLFITTDDRVKILDFGLAKLTSDASAVAASALQTARPLTEMGQVLGTVGYMAPEQVRGLAVDPRADLFALGTILYEMVSGRRAFHRDTAPETMTAILNDHPPDLIATDRSIPPGLARIVDRCLEKSPSARFQTASDLTFALEALSDASGSSLGVERVTIPVRHGREWIAWAIVVLLLLALAPLVYQRVRRERPAPSGPTRFQIPPTAELAGPGNFSLSPDGRQLAFYGLGADGVLRLRLRSMDTLEVRPLPGTELSIGTGPPPFWSPDSKFIAFQGSDAKLKKLDVSGGPPQALCDVPGLTVGGSWNRDGDIILGNTAGGLLRVRETGGAVSPLTALDASRKEEFHLMPTFLPDGRHFVYLRISPSAPEMSGSYVGTLDAKPDEQSAQRLMPYVVGLTYAPAGDADPGRLLFLREGTLMAQPFDTKRLALTGNPVPVAERVGSFRDGGFFSASSNDVLVYRIDNTDFQLAWFDRQGASSQAWEPGAFRSVALAPDGSRAVVSRTNPQDGAKADLWLLDLPRRGGATRLTFDAGLVEFPLWSRDGKRIMFTVNNSALYQKLASGEGDVKEVMRSKSVGLISAADWSPDGRFLLYVVIESPATLTDLWVLPSDGRQPSPFVQSRFIEQDGRFSPDGRWVAYTSDQSGAMEVYVRAFSPDFSGGSASTGGSVLVSRGGGAAPRWRGDGRELFYLAPDGKMNAVEVTAGPEFRGGTPEPLFQTPSGTIVGDVTADGKRFLLVTPVGPSASAPFTVVLNWTAALKK